MPKHNYKKDYSYTPLQTTIVLYYKDNTYDEIEDRSFSSCTYSYNHRTFISTQDDLLYNKYCKSQPNW